MTAPDAGAMTPDDPRLSAVLTAATDARGEARLAFDAVRPAVTLSKWNGAAQLVVRYDAVTDEAQTEQKIAAAAIVDQKVQWKATTQELHAYEIPPRDEFHEGGLEMEVVLNERPATNRLDFALENYEDLDFFYQPPLANLDKDGSTWEDNGRGGRRRRPVDVGGSFAVYHKTLKGNVLGGINYATGKAFHIYRPTATDANGVTVVCTLEYDGAGTLTVVVPQDFLDSAAYPIPVDPTFGFTSAGASDDDPGPYQILVKADSTPASNGTLTSMSVIGRIDFGAPEFDPAIYSDSAGAPNAKLAGVDSGGTVFGGSDAVVTTSISYGSISSGVQYWLGVMSKWAGGANDAFVKFDSATGEIWYGNGAGGGTLPWPATAVLINNNVTGVRWSIYATYTAGGGGTFGRLVGGSLAGGVLVGGLLTGI